MTRSSGSSLGSPMVSCLILDPVVVRTRQWRHLWHPVVVIRASASCSSLSQVRSTISSRPDLAEVTAPPYDVITTPSATSATVSPGNVVHIDLPAEVRRRATATEVRLPPPTNGWTRACSAPTTSRRVYGTGWATTTRPATPSDRGDARRARRRSASPRTKGVFPQGKDDDSQGTQRPPRDAALVSGEPLGGVGAFAHAGARPAVRAARLRPMPAGPTTTACTTGCTGVRRARRHRRHPRRRRRVDRS